MRLTRSGSAGGDAPGSDGRYYDIIVGNAPAGDTLAICDILDTGNGMGWKAALAAANTFTPKKAVFPRRGFYDLGAAGSDGLPIVIPAGVFCICDGQNQTIVRTAADASKAVDLAAFTVNGELWDCGVLLKNLTSTNPGAALGLVTVTGTGTMRRVTLTAEVITVPDRLGAIAIAVVQYPGSLTEDVNVDSFPILGAGGGPFGDFLAIVGAAPSSDLTRIVRPHTNGTSAAGVGLTGGAVGISVQHSNVEIIEPWLIDVGFGGIFVETDGDITANVQITDPHIEWRYTDAGTGGRQAIRVKAADAGGIIGVCDSVRVTRGWFDNFAVNGTGSRAIAFIGGGGGGFASVVKNCEVIGATCRNWDEAAHISKSGISVVDANGIVDTDTGGAPIVNVNDLNFRTMGNW